MVDPEQVVLVGAIKIEDNGKIWICLCCKTDFSSNEELEKHYRGKKK